MPGKSMLESWFSLEGLNVVVTGGGSNLGEKTAVAMAQAGASVMICHDVLADAERVANGIVRNGGKAMPLIMDVASEQSVMDGFAVVRREFSRLDSLFVGAVKQGRWPITELTAEQWDRQMNTNLRGAFLCCREAVKMMLESGAGGTIIGLSTIGSLHPASKGHFAYGPSKAGLNMLMRNIANEYAKQGIRANAVLPGFVTGNIPEAEHKPDYDPQFPADRLPYGPGPGEEIAKLAVYLAGPSATYISAQCIAVDGGFSAL